MNEITNALYTEIDLLKKRVEELEAALTEERQRNRVGEAVIRENEALTKENLDLFASRNEWIQKIDQLTAENARLRKALERIADYDSYHNEWPNEIWINAPPEELAKVILAGGEYPPEQALKEDSHEG